MQVLQRGQGPETSNSPNLENIQMLMGQMAEHTPFHSSNQDPR